MELSLDLLSKFAKATKDDKKKSTETTVYGTTVVKDNTTYVRIDGSDILTPVIAAADTHDNERVIVMIKNHTATITGNISSPAARSGDMNDVTNTAGSAAEVASRVDRQVGALTNTVNECVNDIDNLQKQVLTLTSSITTINQSIVLLNEEIVKIKTRLQNLENAQGN